MFVLTKTLFPPSLFTPFPLSSLSLPLSQRNTPRAYVLFLSCPRQIPHPDNNATCDTGHTNLKRKTSGGTCATILDTFDQVWTGGRAVLKKMDDPLLLAATNPPDARVAFEHADSSPGGFGYDSVAKCEQNTRDAVLTLWPGWLWSVCLFHYAYFCTAAKA